MSECSDGVLELFIGDDWSIPFNLTYQNSGKPFPLTGATEISMSLKKADGTLLTKLLSTYVSGNGITITSGAGGSGLVEIPKAESALIKKGELVTHSMTITIGGKEKTAEFPKNLTFKQR
jgi:hypothetical protein